MSIEVSAVAGAMFMLTLKLNVIEDYLGMFSSLITSLLMFTAAGFYYGSTNFNGVVFHCALPQEYSASWSSSAQSSCFRSPLFIIPENPTTRKVFDENGVPNYKSINYYSHLLTLTMVGAFLSLLPRVLWKMALLSSHIKLANYLQEFNSIIALPLDQRDRRISQLSDQIMYAADTKSVRIPIIRVFLFPRPGILFFNILKRTLYVCNFAAQLFVSYLVFDHGLGPAWPIKYLINSVWSGVDNNEVFPDTAYCEYKMFSSYGGETHKHLLNCELPLNRFAKIVTIVHWFWMCGLGAISVYFLLQAIYDRFSKSLLEEILYSNQELVKADKTTRTLVNRFKKTIPQEFVFVLQHMNAICTKSAQRSIYYLYTKWLASQGDDDEMHFRKIVAPAPSQQKFSRITPAENVNFVGLTGEKQMETLLQKQVQQQNFIIPQSPVSLYTTPTVVSMSPNTTFVRCRKIQTHPEEPYAFHSKIPNDVVINV